MLFKKMIGSLSLVLISCSAFATPPSHNFISIATPPGSGYLWCEIKPAAGLANKLKQNPMNNTLLKSFSAFIATHCVNLSGMDCDPNAAQGGTLSTSLEWLKVHYLKYEKSGKENGDAYSNCGRSGVVQIRVDYDYTVRCHVTKTPPKKLSAVNKPVC